jgi:hypothetical protein
MSATAATGDDGPLVLNQLDARARKVDSYINP